VSGKIVIIENESWRSLDAARQDQIEGCLRLVAGARRSSAPSLLEALAEGAGASPRTFPLRGSAISLFPVLLPSQEASALALVRALERAMPFKNLFGLVVLLIGEEGFAGDSLMDSFWVDVLDGLYDIAVPTHVVAWHGGQAAVEGFQLAASASALIRELDSLEELARLSGMLGDLETRVDDVESRTSVRGADPE